MQVGGKIIYILLRDQKKKIDGSYKAYSLKAAVNGQLTEIADKFPMADFLVV